MNSHEMTYLIFLEKQYQMLISCMISFSTLRVNLILRLSVLRTKPDAWANSVAPDEMVHYEQSHQDLYCLPFCFEF